MVPHWPDRLPSETRVAADDDAGVGPAGADLRNTALELRHAAGQSVSVGGAQARAPHMVTAEDVDRQMAVSRHA